MEARSCIRVPCCLPSQCAMRTTRIKIPLPLNKGERAVIQVGQDLAFGAMRAMQGYAKKSHSRSTKPSM